MKRSILAASVLAAIASSATAAPSAPSIDMYGSNNLQFSKVELAMDTTSGYKSMVKYNEEAKIAIKFNQWSGTTGDTYKVFFDGTEVASGPIKGSQTSAIFGYAQGGVYDVVIQACDTSGCTPSASKKITVADTDGSHLSPLKMNVDANNKSYNTDKSKVVGTYFVEWGIYDRNYTVDNIPADNLTHILYGFIPICGPNESLKSVGGNSFNALQKACAGSQDFEVVIHDPWAAYQKSFKQAGHDFNTPIKGNFAMMMALKQRNPDLKILPSVGGWTLSDPFFSFTEKANRDVFVGSVKEFLTTWKFFDGVDIDWEFPGGGGENASLGDPVKDGPAYIALMQELRAMLDELELANNKEYELTSAIGVGFDKIEDVDYGDAIQYMDYIFAMTYDFYGGWNNVPGHQTALYCGSFMAPGQCDGSGVDAEGVQFKGPAYTVDNGIQLLLAQGVPANQLVVGAAMYGRGWNGVMESSLTDPSDPMTGMGNGKLTGSKAQGIWEAGVIDYKGIKKYMLGADEKGINGFEAGYDEQAEAPYVWNKATGQLITFDSARSIKAKGSYINTLGLAGIFSWEIDADNGDILNAMHEGLAITDGTLPTPTPVVTPTPIVVTPTPVVVTPTPVVVTPTPVVVTPTPVVVTPTPVVVTPTPVVGITPYIPGKTKVSNGDVVSYNGTCFEAQNNPGQWETPSATSWFWTEVACEGGAVITPTPAVTPVPPLPTSTPIVTPTPTVTPTPVVGDSTWKAESVYNSGDSVVVNGTTYIAGWWTKGQAPGTTGEWGVWKEVK